MKKVLVILIAVMLTGCVQRLAVMENPKTGEVIQCRHDVQDPLNSSDIDNCIEGYKKAGWINLTEPKKQP